MRSFRLRRLAMPLLVLAFAAGTAQATTTYEQAESTYYLAWQDCGTDADTYLSLDTPAPNYCAWYGLPANEVFYLAEETWVDVYTTQGGTPFILDGDRNLTGEIHIHSPSGLTGAGLGQVVVEGTVSVRVPRATGTGTQTVQIGEFSGEGIAMPTSDTVAFPVDLDVPAGLHQADVQSLTLELVVRGLSIDSSTEASGGLSKLVVPTLVETTPED